MAKKSLQKSKSVQRAKKRLLVLNPTRWYHNFALVAGGFLLALIFCSTIFEMVKGDLGWSTGNVHNAAPKNGQTDVLQTHSASSSKLTYSAGKMASSYAAPGQKDVALLDFTLNPSNDGFIRGLSFSLSNLALPYDLKVLKLFVGDEKIGEVSFFDGKGDFKNLMVKVQANSLAHFHVLGDINDQAEMGDRLVLNMNNKIDAEDSDGSAFSLVAQGNLSGPAVSVVHGNSGADVLDEMNNGF